MVHKTTGRNRLAMWIAAILASVAPAASAQDDSVLEPALHYFTRHDAGDIFELFDSVRPAPVSDAERGRILAMLPAEGDLRDLDTAQRRKLAAVRRVLELHRREAVYVIKVIDDSPGRRGFARSRGRAGLGTGARSPRRRRASGACGP